MARVVDRAMANPAASGGLLVMALTASAIVVNATLLQSANHARPNPPTRSAAHVLPSAAAVPTPRTRESVSNEVTQSPAVSRNAAGASPAAKPATVPAATAAKAVTVAVPLQPPTTTDQKLISDVQRELQRLGLYGGVVDGLLGKRTQTAIASYQRNAGLTADGIPSAELLAQMRKAGAAAVPPVAAPVAKPGPIPPALITGAVSATPMPAKPASPSPVAASSDAVAADPYRRVQLALNQAGYGPIPVDGRGGKETVDAIRRFELDYGLPVTGQPNEAVMKRLVAIGALAAG